MKFGTPVRQSQPFNRDYFHDNWCPICDFMGFWICNCRILIIRITALRIISWEKHSVNQVIQVLLQFKHENLPIWRLDVWLWSSVFGVSLNNVSLTSLFSTNFSSRISSENSMNQISEKISDIWLIYFILYCFAIKHT